MPLMAVRKHFMMNVHELLYFATITNWNISVHIMSLPTESMMGLRFTSATEVSLTTMRHQASYPADILNLSLQLRNDADHLRERVSK